MPIDGDYYNLQEYVIKMFKKNRSISLAKLNIDFIGKSKTNRPKPANA